MERPEPGEFHDIDMEAGMLLCESRGFELQLSAGESLEQLREEGSLVTYAKTTVDP